MQNRGRQTKSIMVFLKVALLNDVLRYMRIDFRAPRDFRSSSHFFKRK